MAETVLYLINSTDDSTRIAIQPRTFDGVGGVQRNTSLTLYGNNAPRWGEKFNENFYHLLENFAVDEVPSVLPLRPLDETDIGEEGLGLNLPILGQTWYNKTRDALFLYTSNGFGDFRWTPVASVGIIDTDAGLANFTSNRTGDLAFSSDTEELKIWNGVEWAVVREAGAGPVALSLNDLTDVVLGTPVVGQVLKYNGTYWYNGSDNQASGGGGTGTVTSISGSGSIVASPASITTTGSMSLVNDVTSPGASRYYGTNSAGVKGWHAVPTGGGGGGGGGGVTDHGALTGLADDDHPQYLLTSGSRAMSGTLNMNSNYVTNLLNPVNAQDGATKSYVDNKPAGGAFLASGSGGNGAAIAFPSGYNHSTCYIVTAFSNVNMSGGAGMDILISYATNTGTGWTLTSYASRENQGSNVSITTRYWILSK